MGSLSHETGWLVFIEWEKLFYAIDAFPDDAQLWRIDWIGGVAYDASVPSEALIDVCLARLPTGLLLSRK